jgi:hypothetical protein
MTFSIKEIHEHLQTIPRLENHINVKEYTFFKLYQINNILFRFHAGDVFSLPNRVMYQKLTDYQAIGVRIFEAPDNTIIDEGAEIYDIGICPMIDPRFQRFSWSRYFTYETSGGKVNYSYMGSRIPIDQVPQLINDVLRVSKLKLFF